MLLNLRCCLLTAACVLTGRLLFAQTEQYQFSHLDINSGLSHNQITCIYKDNKGFMWFGTMSGLNRYDGYKVKVFKHAVHDVSTIDDDYIVSISEGPSNKLWVQTRYGNNIYDPSTEHFDHNIKNTLAAIGIPDSAINSIKKDRFGNFWFTHLTQGLYKYNPVSNKTIHFIHHADDTTTIYNDAITYVAENVDGDFWIAHPDCVIEKLDHRTNKVTRRIYGINKLHGREISYLKLFVDRQNDLWAFDSGSPWGLYYLNTKGWVFKHIDKNTVSGRLDADIISNVIQDDKNIIWIATDHGGVNLLDKRTFAVRYLVHREDDNKSLSQNSTISIYKDATGIVWVGTYKQGVSYYHENIIKFPVYRHYLTDPNSLCYNDVNKFAEDNKGNLWIGTNGRGLIYFDRQKNVFTNYLNNPANTNSLSNNVIVSLCIDHQNKLWIGTYFGGLDCFDGKTFTHYRHNSAVRGSISDDRIWEIMEDSANNLWVGTLGGGLNLLHKNKKEFTHYVGEQNNSIHNNYISGLVEDEKKNLWIATSYGIDVHLHQSNTFYHYDHNEKANSLINNNVTNLLEDSRHLLWFATREGLSVLNPATQKFTNLRKEDGLPDNTMLDILEDDRHNMWISTPNGLSNIIVKKTKTGLSFRFINYDETDGLQGRAFNENASFKTKKGELIFGGANGFNLFKPSDIRSDRSQTSLIFTDFQVFNKSLSPGEDIEGHIILSKSISETQALTLKNSERAFSIEFAALNFFNPGKIKLEYKLEGFDKVWINSDNKIRKATYTNLDAGSYTFKVRAAGYDGAFNSTVPLTLQITVLPPIWKTGWAYLCYILAALSALFYIRHRGIQKIELKYALERERQEAQRMHELDMMKIKFFTNVSHEFRTPLALIMAPVDKILKRTVEPEDRKQLQLVNRNAKRLLNMVNQLLDFRKMEVQELKLHARNGDIIRFIKEMSYSFSDVADKKNINFIFDSEVDELEANFDHDKIERILFNLLSNAFKFTHQGGNVSVLLALNDKTAGQHLLEIKIIDTGIGIPRDKQDKIFERFFQNEVPGSMVNQGSGIGLSITREFVKLHNGEIFVESEVNQGSYFTVLLPLNIPAETSEQFSTPEPEETWVPDDKQQQPEIENPSKKLTVLLVEDNDDFRFYLKDNLKEAFTIIEAVNGKEGWQKTLAQHPNLVVSDISMPEMNGIELCRKIRNDKRTLHIPVVLLTALTGEEQQLQGLETGANDYMTKPFNFEILLSKLKNILALQEDMRKTYQKRVDAKPSEVAVESTDEIFIKKVLLLIEKNIDNPDFSVEELSHELYVSRVTLYKRALSLTGKSPVELIRTIRLKRAAQLLESGQLTISQISYKVGFKSQKYFVRSFKAEFNCLPSAYIQAKKVGQAHLVN